MDYFEPMMFKCLLCGDIVYSHYFGHMNECKCGNLVMQEDPDGYYISTNVDDTSEFVVESFGELETKALMEETCDFNFDETSDIPF